MSITPSPRVPPPPSSHLAQMQPNLRWLIRLRTFAFVAQVAGYAILSASLVPAARVGLPLIAAITALSNWGLLRLSKRVSVHSARTPGSKQSGSVGVRNALGWTLSLDCVLLTVWLGLTGGTTNPLTVLYLVHIVLGAVVLTSRWTAWLSTLSALGFGALFLVPTQACCTQDFDDGAHTAYLTHMQGMWFSFAVAALLISYFVRQLTLEAERQRQHISALQSQTQRAAHMISLTTLAAGTAHELRTPLGTIAVAAHELKQAAARLGHTDILDDAQLIDVEVQRCQAILTDMGLRWCAGEEAPKLCSASSIVRALEAEFLAAERLSSKTAPPRIQLDVGTHDSWVRVVKADLLIALRGVINNAIDATSVAGGVVVRVSADAEHVHFEVEDSGPGMPPEVLQRATDPFYTTKDPGKGVGLGLFVAFAFAENIGGHLQVDSSPESGTRVSLSVPRYCPNAGAVSASPEVET